MVLITEELIRKRSEHNDCIISTLEELSLHQEDIEKIDHIQNWCRDIKILLLQANLISKIENLNKMKHLEYLNLALNNIEVIENLEGCESLQKLDLTLNFIGDLLSVERLQNNYHLKHLYLTGNPCSDYEGYREFVIATLPQLQTLDSREIERSDWIKAMQNYDLIRPQIITQQLDYKKKRGKQKKQAEERNKSAISDDSLTADDDFKFWEEMSENTPETRIEMAKRSKKSKEKTTNEKTDTIKREIKLFNKSGRPNNINEAKIPFSIEDDEERNCFILTLKIYKHLDTSLLEVNVQPQFVTVRVKGKVFQITLNEEVKAAQSTVLRSQTTGYLLITMPKEKGIIKQKPSTKQQAKLDVAQIFSNTSSKRQYLEIGKDDSTLDYSKIVQRHENVAVPQLLMRKVKEKAPSSTFKDNPEVPPLV